MSLLKKIDKLLASFGNIKALERTHVDTFTENQITSITGQKIAESREGQFWVDFKSLAGYDFMESTILSRMNIKTWDGGVLILNGENSNLILNSDNTEIESDFSNISNTWITKVSFIVSQDEINFIKEKSAYKIVFKYKKETISFTTLK